MAVSDVDGRIAVSSWSVHRQLGVTYPHNLDSDTVGPREETYGPGEVDLIDLPARVASHHIRRLELCSFHLPSRDKVYLDELRSAFVSARVRLQTLLIEAGDLSDPNTAARDAGWISGWVDVANDLGAENARIIAGKQKSTKDALDLAAKGLKAIGAGNSGPVKLVTENWFDLLATPDAVNYLLDQCEGQIGLNGDFGNWTGEGKYEALSKIFGRASICHAKASFAHGAMNGQDYGRCVDVAEAAGYTGPYTLIFDSNEPDEWDGIAIERAFIRDRLSGN
jgi:sugar phosphate isomerase/epimerase